MKRFYRFLLISLGIFASAGICLAQNPTYTLSVNDITEGENWIEFDIDMTWTNPGTVPVFEFAGAQYFLNVNPLIGGGGTVTMSNAGSQLPTNMQPRNPTVYTSSNPWQLRWAVNTFPGMGSGFPMPPNIPVKMVRVRLQTTAQQFPVVPINLDWRNSLPNPFTKIFCYTPKADISTPSTHSIDWNLSIEVSDSGVGKDSLTFGLHFGATDGIDQQLGELPLPPTPPQGVFDCRLVLPTSDASKKDLRNSTTGSVDWRIAFQPSNAGYPIVFSWNTSKNFAMAGYYLKDEITGNIVNVDMTKQSSFTLTNSGITSLKLEYRFNPTIGTSVNLGWNIVSVPLRTSNMLYTVLFPGVASQAYKYSNGYESISNLSNGSGYWMNFNNPSNYSFTGSKVTPTNMAVTDGWNLIGPFDNNIPISTIMSNPAGIVTSNYFGYNGGYYNPDTLKVGRGYWIRTSTAGYLYQGSADNNTNAIATNPLEEFVEVRFTNGDDNSTALYLGNASELTSDYSMPPVPPSGIYDVRFGTDKLVEALGGNHVLKISSATAETRLRVNNTDGMKFRIKDGIDGSLLNKELTEGTEIIIPTNLNNLILETSAAIPLTYELGQNYPNPFNPVTTIKYQIPEDGAVKMSVYDVLGKEVKTLVNDFRPAGAYEVRLDANDLSSGIYFYQMRAEHFEEMRKMVVIK